MASGPLKYFANNGCFLTGVTGFVGKVLLEKILRSAPGPAPIYVLVRPGRDMDAQERLTQMMKESKCFSRLRQEMGDQQFESYFVRRVRVVSGDVLSSRLGLTQEIQEEMAANVKIVVHLAASVDFNMRLDWSLDINAKAALELMQMAKEWGVQSYVHVSTCYVNANRLQPDQKIVQEQLYELRVDPHTILKERESNRNNLTDLAIDKWKLEVMGKYPNTYTFTKSIGEHLIAQHRGNFPLAIVRPSIIGSSWREPFAGWVDNISAAGAVFLAGGLGILTVLPGDPANVGDLIPVDIVANHCIVAAYKIRGRDELQISHCATSATNNPMKWRVAMHDVGKYFNDHPAKARMGPCDFRMTKRMQIFEIQWFLRYSVPTAVMGKVAEALGSPKLIEKALKMRRGVQRMAQVVQLFKHFTMNEWFFQLDHSKEWIAEQDPISAAELNIDTTELVWTRYLQHFAFGLNYFLLKEDLVPITSQHQPSRPIAAHSTRLLDWDADHDRLSYPGLMPDLWWIYTSNREPGYFDGSFMSKVMELTGWQQEKLYPLIREQKELPDPKLTVLDSEIVNQAIIDHVADPKSEMNDKAQARTEASVLLDRIAAKDGEGSRRVLGYALRKIFRRLFTGIIVDETGMATVRRLKKENKGPVVLLPTHRSYFDFLLLSYVCFGFSLDLPYIAAAEDFLGLGPVTAMLRKSRAFFLNRKNFSNKLYKGVLNAYMQELVKAHRTIEFFVEGTRSRSGKLLSPKMGLLKCMLEPFFSGAVEEITLVPVMIDYEMTVETEMFSGELLGTPKRKETLKNLISAVTVLSKKFGHVSISLGEPISVKEKATEMGLSSLTTVVPPPAVAAPEPETGDPTHEKHKKHKHHKKHGKHKKEKSSPELQTKMYGQNPVSVDTQPPSAIVEWTEPRKAFVSSLAYDVIEVMHANMVCMPTHLVATLLLTYRHGIRKTELVTKVHWLVQLITSRGHWVACVEAEERTALVYNALALLGNLVIELRADFVAPAIILREDSKNALALTVLRNKIVHIFAAEGSVTCALNALQTNRRSDPGKIRTGMLELGEESVPMADLVTASAFLSSLLYREFVRKDVEGLERNVEALKSLVSQGVLTTDVCGDANGEMRVRVTPSASANATCIFMCSLMWPFVESYWVAAIGLFGLQPDVQIGEADLVTRLQWLAETLYHDRILQFYESCSMDTLRNAIDVFTERGILVRGEKMRLSDTFSQGKELQKFLDHLGKFRQLEPTSAEVSRALSLAAGMINTHVRSRL